MPPSNPTTDSFLKMEKLKLDDEAKTSLAHHLIQCCKLCSYVETHGYINITIHAYSSVHINSVQPSTLCSLLRVYLYNGRLFPCNPGRGPPGPRRKLPQLKYQ